MSEQINPTENWQICAEAPDLLVDGLDRTIAIMTSHGFEGTKEERQAKQLANARRIIAAVSAYGKDELELLAAKDEEIARLKGQIAKAHENFRKFDSIVEEEGVVQSCINPYEDIRIAIRHLKQRAESAEAKLSELTPTYTRGQIVRVDHERYHGEGIVESVSPPRGAFVGVRLENDNVWQYEAETVKPAGELPDKHWIMRRGLPAEHQTVLNDIAAGLGVAPQWEVTDVEWDKELVAEQAVTEGPQASLDVQA